MNRKNLNEDLNGNSNNDNLQNINKKTKSSAENGIEDFTPDEEFNGKFNRNDNGFADNGKNNAEPYGGFANFAENENNNGENFAQRNNNEYANKQTVISGTKTPPPLTPARRVAEGALMAALSVILGFLAFYTPVLSVVLLVLYPFPIAYLIKRHNTATGLTAFAVSAVLLALLLGIPNAAFVILSMGAVGIWYGIAFRKDIKPMKTLLIGAVLAALSVVCTTLLSFAVMGTAISDITAVITETVNETVAVMQSSGFYDLSAMGIDVEDFKNSMISMMTTMIPGMFIVVAMLEAWLCYVLTAGILRRMGLAVKELPKFRFWHLPWPALWGLIIALVLYIGYHYSDYQVLKTITVNILYIYYPVLLISGISLVVWLRKTTGALMLPVLIVICFFLFPAGAVLGIMILGLGDSALDFRTRAEKNRQKYINRK